MQDFFENGIYDTKIIIFPCVVYPNGKTLNITTQIKKIYDGSHKFLAWNISSKLSTTIIYDNTTNYLYFSLLGSGKSGYWSIQENLLTVLGTGYSYSQADIINQKIIYEKKNDGFTIKIYKFDEIKKDYVIYSEKSLKKKSNIDPEYNQLLCL